MKVSAFPNIGTPRGPGSFRTLSREEEDLVKYQYVKPTAAVAAAAVTTVVVSISLPQSLSICNVSKSLARANFPRKSVDRECGRYDSSADGNIIAWARL